MGLERRLRRLLPFCPNAFRVARSLADAMAFERLPGGGGGVSHWPARGRRASRDWPAAAVVARTDVIGVTSGHSGRGTVVCGYVDILRGK